MYEAYTTSLETYEQNDLVSFPNVKFSDCRINQLNGTTFKIKQCGRYYVNVNVVGASGTAASQFSIQLYNNGVPIPATQSIITSTVANEEHTLNANTIVQVRPSCMAMDNSASLTVVVTSSVAGLIVSGNIIIMKVK